MARLTAEAARAPGHLGATVLRPDPQRPGDAHRFIYKFDRRSSLEAWHRSDLRAQLFAPLEPLIDSDRFDEFAGLETWFELPGAGAAAALEDDLGDVGCDLRAGHVRKLRLPRPALPGTDSGPRIRADGDRRAVHGIRGSAVARPSAARVAARGVWPAGRQESEGVTCRRPSSSSDNGRLTTLNRAAPSARPRRCGAGASSRSAASARCSRRRRPTARESTWAGGAALPGLNDSHLHLIRGGLNYNLELRWDGVPSLADALRRCCASRRGARRRRSGCAWSAAGTSGSSPRSGCRRLPS